MEVVNLQTHVNACNVYQIKLIFEGLCMKYLNYACNGIGYAVQTTESATQNSSIHVSCRPYLCSVRDARFPECNCYNQN